jgi:membrane protein
MTVIERWVRDVFESDVSDSGWLARVAVYSLRFGVRVLGKFQDQNLHLQSTSLAYTTLLSMVPFLAVTFSVLKGFGVQNQLEPVLMQTLEPLGEQGAEIGQYILSYVNNLNFAVLGFMGIALLFWTVISLLTKVEEAFNTVWHVAGVRSWSRRFSDYLSVALVGPVFIFSAFGVTTVALGDERVQRLASIEPLGMLILGLGRLVPYLLVCAAFAFLYSFLTNYRVRPVPALIGGLFASVAWYGVGNLFALLVASSSKYSAIYSSLAAAVLFIMWVNIGWLIILVGAHIARYWQHPHLLKLGEIGADSRQVPDEALALNLMALIGDAYYSDGPKWTLEALAARGCCGAPDLVEGLVRSLQARRLIVATREEPEAFFPARAIETIPLSEIVAAVRGYNNRSVVLPPVKEVLDRVENAVSMSLEGRSLKDLVLAIEGYRGPPAPESVEAKTEAGEIVTQPQSA